MHQIQIHIIQPQLLQAEIQRLLDARVECAPQLGRHEQVLALDLARGQGGLDPAPDVLLVLVDEGGVDVPVSDRDGVADGAFDVGAGLPCSCFKPSVAMLGLSQGMDRYPVRGPGFRRRC